TNHIGEMVARDESQHAAEIRPARAAAYVGSDKGPIPEAGLALVDTAARVERDGILKPITHSALEQADAADSAFVTWEKSSTELLEQQHSENVSWWMNTGLMILSVGASAAEAGMGGPMASSAIQNNQVTMQTALQGSLDASQNLSAISTSLSQLNV